ncbi:PucR family transcriptional regulator [Rhodococcus triatomae]
MLDDGTSGAADGAGVPESAGGRIVTVEDSTRPPLRIAGRDVARSLSASTGDLAAAVAARLADDMPIYRALPAGEIEAIAFRCIELFATLLFERRAPRESELAEPRNSAARRAEEGVPLEAVLHAYHIGVEMASASLSAGAGPDDVADVLVVNAMVLDFLRRLTIAVSSAYFDERQIMESQENSGRRSLMSALVAGEDLDAVVTRTGLRLAPNYLVLSLVIGENEDERRLGVNGTVAGRRKVRRLQAELDRITGEHALTVIDSGGGLALVPCSPSPPDWEHLRVVVERLERVLGARLHAAGTTAPPAGVPEAVEQTTDILALVTSSRRPPGLYRLTDVLLDYQLSRPSAARRELAALLAPLAGKPELMQTLEAYIASGLNRRATAATLAVHANTVDYRMRRVLELTGLNPTDPSDLPRIGAALVAMRSGA